MVGTRLGHYEIRSRVGRGGMGEVFVARDTRLGRDVALKFLPPEVAERPDRRARFAREAQAVAAIRHPGIVTIHAIEEVDGYHFLAMELVDGETLSRRIPEGGMEPEPLLDLAVQIADAVGAAHARGITHRDLKPANVMVDPDGRAKVLDFGLAKSSAAAAAGDAEAAAPGGPDRAATVAATELTGDLTTEGSVLGTVHYMSPEQAEGRDIGPASDVFALGIVLYEMATGARPFRGATSLSILSAILKDEPPPVTRRNGALPPELDAIVARCLHKDPARRYPDASALRDALAGLRDDSGTAVRAPAAAPVAFGRRRRRAVLVTAVVVVAAAVAWMLRPSGEDGAAPAIGASGRPAIAVFQFRDHSGDEEIRWLATGVPSMLLTGLAQTPGLDVVSSARVDEILRKIGRENVAEIDRSILAEVARRSGAGAVVLGSIYKSGDVIRIDVQVEDVETGRVLFAREASGGDPFPIVDRLAVAIRDGLELGDAPQSSRPIADVSSRSLEAYRAYDEGARALEVYRMADAKRALTRALALDPEFSMAHYLLARLQGQQGESEAAAAHLVEAWNHRDRLPERQRALVEADYLLLVRRDPAAAAEVLEDLIRRFPDEVEAYMTLASVRVTTDPARRLDVLRRAVEEVPTSGALRNEYAATLMRSGGSTDEALRQLEIYESLEPEEANPRDSLAEVYLNAGRPEDALRKYAEVLEIESSFASAHTGRALAFGVLGRFDEALRELDAAIALLEEQGLSTNGMYGPKGLFLLRVGRYEESAAAAARDRLPGEGSDGFASRFVAVFRTMRARDWDGAVESARAMRSRLATTDFPEIFRIAGRVSSMNVEGVAEVRAGRLDRAYALREQLAEFGRNPVVPWATDWLAGEIALAEGNLDEAERAFRAGVPDRRVVLLNIQQGFLGSLSTTDPVSRDWKARLLVARGDLDGAVATYRALNEPSGDAPFVALFEPLYVLETARLLDRQGKRPEAMREYRRFLELWKNADEGRPEVREAREYVASG